MNFQGLEFDGVPTDSDVLSDTESVSSLVDEDVDFGYVYALFNFPQMVEGQVTVEEGEKLTLLDDSNSYWWLVQNLRDNQMGYIPADNIETAFGKLARVNRRKNLKLAKPDPEHMAARDTPSKPNARRVVFDNNPVTQVFINSSHSDEEYEEYEDDEYDAYDEVDTTEPAVVPSQDIEDDADSVDYSSYYYSADADDADADNTPPSSARRVSIAPMSMGEIDGELYESDMDNDSDTDIQRHSTGSGITGLYTDRRESTVLEQTDDTPAYYLSNEESDDGDSLSGVLNRIHSGDAQEHRHTLHIQHVDAFGSTDASVAVFADELLGDVLGRALAVFGLAGTDTRMALYAQFGSHDLAILPSETQAAMLLDRIRDKLSSLPDSGAIDADVCTLLLADRSVPLAQLLAPNGAAREEEDPYAGMETGSRSILRTSIAASVSEGIASLATTSALNAPPNSEHEYSVHAGSVDSDLVPTERQALSSSQDADDMDTSDIAATDVDALPDSRSVVQGLLRSIPRPTSQPPQSAINRAKRNTVQISARGSVVDDSYVASPPTRPALTRSASTRATPDPASAPLEPAQALAHSASTLRPSSDTFTHDDSVPSSPHAALEDGSASPTESVETVSSHHESEDAGPAALTALAHSAPHRLKDAAVHAELSLDDWLVVLRGWGDMHDASSAFYRTLLRDIDSSDPVLADAHSFISGHVAALADSKSPVDDILSVSQGVGRRLDTLERELDDIARILVHAN